jgi:hypothetical protein
MIVDGINVTMALKLGPDEYKVTRVDEIGIVHYDPVDLGVEVHPTIRLEDGMARALLDALLRYYQGSGDYHTLRKDYLDERARVDRLTNTLASAVGKLIDIT